MTTIYPYPSCLLSFYLFKRELWVMQRLQDPKWQSSYLAANGIAHVPWEPVFRSYEKLSEAADVLGRPDFAEALETRITPQLCREYAPLLAVLRRVARDPLSKPLADFPPEESGPTDQDIWNEAMQSIESELQPAEFSTSDDLEGEYESLEASHDVESPLSDEFSPNEAERSLDLDMQPGKLSVLSPLTLSHSHLIRELCLCLFGYRSLHSSHVVGISDRCCASIWDRFDHHAAELAKLPNDLQVAARSDIASWNCRTILQLLHNTEKLVTKYVRGPKCIDTSSINMLLNGDFQSPALVQNGDNYAYAPALKPELRHPMLLPAGECAALATRIHGEKLPQVSVTFISLQQYSADIYRVHARNSKLLMTFSLKERILACWRALAGVFLAQDPRILIFMNEFVHEINANEINANEYANHQEAQLILDNVWPSAPFVLDERFVPKYVCDLDRSLEAVLGSRLEKLFPHKRLAAAWNEVLSAFKNSDQLVELAMAEEAAKVEARIRAADTLLPFI